MKDAFGVERGDRTLVSKLTPRLVYHGTGSRAWGKIRMRGIKQGRGDLGEGTYTSSNVDHADHYSWQQAGREQPKDAMWDKGKSTKGRIIAYSVIGPPKSSRIHTKGQYKWGGVKLKRDVVEETHDPRDLVQVGSVKTEYNSWHGRRKRGKFYWER